MLFCFSYVTASDYFWLCRLTSCSLKLTAYLPLTLRSRIPIHIYLVSLKHRQPYIYSKPSLIQLQLISMLDNLHQSMKNAVHSWVHKTHGIWEGRWVTFKPALLCSKTSTTSESSFDEYTRICIVFLWFLYEGCTVIFCYLFSSALLISLNFPFICVLCFF
jgi:hypothetical protein